jgi:hypothetical protein
MSLITICQSMAQNHAILSNIPRDVTVFGTFVPYRTICRYCTMYSVLAQCRGGSSDLSDAMAARVLVDGLLNSDGEPSGRSELFFHNPANGKWKRTRTQKTPNTDANRFCDSVRGSSRNDPAQSSPTAQTATTAHHRVPSENTRTLAQVVRDSTPLQCTASSIEEPA